MVFLKFLTLFLLKNLYRDNLNLLKISLYLYVLYDTTIENMFITRTVLLIDHFDLNYINIMMTTILYKYIVHENPNIILYFMFITNTSDLIKVFTTTEQHRIILSTISLLSSIPLIFLSQNLSFSLSHVGLTHALKL